MNDICCECNQEIKGTKKAKIWNGKLLPMCYSCWVEWMKGGRMIKFTIDLKVNSEYGLNKIYAGVHWTKRKKQAEEIHELVYYSMMQQNVPPILFRKPVRIDISYNSRLDCDNHGYLTKLIVDGMKDYLLKDDSKKYVKEIRQKFWGEKGILVEIWEVV